MRFANFHEIPTGAKALNELTRNLTIKVMQGLKLMIELDKKKKNGKLELKGIVFWSNFTVIVRSVNDEVLQEDPTCTKSRFRQVEAIDKNTKTIQKF